MQQPVRADIECDYESRPSRSHRTKAMVAGVAVASAGALALTPVIVTPSLPEVQVNRADAYGLSAFQNPFEVWGDTFENTFSTVFTTIPAVPAGPEGPAVPERTSLIEAIALANGTLASTLSRPDVQAQFAGVLGNLTDPARYAATFAALPGYADRISAASAGSLETFRLALAGLPGVLEQAAAALADGDIIEAFGEINEWFLADILSGGRAEYLDALRIPGDFFDSLGIEPLARILGTSWMATPGSNGQLNGPGLLSRTVVGNFGRALLAPQVTAIFQTLEIVDDTMKALEAQDYETAVSSLINAPAKITNAFLNGFKPKFVEDGSIPSGPGQNFPGLFSRDSTFDFFLRQIPEAVATALTHPRPETPTPPPPANDATTLLAADAPSSNPLKRKAITVSVDTEVAQTVTPPVIEQDADETTPPADELILDEGTPGEGTTDASDAKPLTTKDRLKQVREQAAEQRQERAEQRAERAEKARATVDRVGSSIRKGLGLPDRSKKDDGAQQGNAGGGEGSGGSDSTGSDNSGSDD